MESKIQEFLFYLSTRIYQKPKQYCSGDILFRCYIRKGKKPPKHCTFDVNQISSTFPIYQLYKICIANNIWSPQDSNVKRELPRGV